MVYRLVPSHRFQAQSHFGTEDMTKPKMLKGLVLGLVVAAIVLGFLAYLILKKNKLQRYAVVKDGKLALDWKKYGLELMLPVILGCLVLGGVLGHCCMSDEGML
jgi:TRAP-type C4-dicarboxylate transport system permease large subunit